MFGVGASIVIIGALLKIHSSRFWIISGNTMLTMQVLITEAIIFAISGVQGYMTGDSSVEDRRAFKQLKLKLNHYNKQLIKQ